MLIAHYEVITHFAEEYPLGLAVKLGAVRDVYNRPNVCIAVAGIDRSSYTDR